MPRVDRAALRIAVFEIDYLDVPDAVAVAEAVALVGELSTDDSPAFVNGVLGSGGHQSRLSLASVVQTTGHQRLAERLSVA